MEAHHQPAAVRHGRRASWASATMLGVLTASSWTGQAEAGIHIDLIEAGVGFVGLPDNFDFFDIYDIANPFVGAFVEGTGYQPNVLTVSTLTTFESNGGVYDGDYASFTFDNEVAGPAWSFPTASIAAARSLIGFTADTDVVVTVTGIVTGSADGRGFIDSDPFPPGDIVIAPSSDPVTYSFTLAAGTHQIVMGGVIYDLTGGSAGFSGSVTITAVPAPAVTASLALLGLAGRRRRR
jgi:MYXO-CTERM domain-containing protein